MILTISGIVVQVFFEPAVGDARDTKLQAIGIAIARCKRQVFDKGTSMHVGTPFVFHLHLAMPACVVFSCWQKSHLASCSMASLP